MYRPQKMDGFFMVNFNGTISKEKKLVGIDNRGLNYGDALFETLRITEGKILFWEDHYFRLMASMRILRMEIPMGFTMESLEAEVFKLTDQYKETTLRVKFVIWRKSGGLYTPSSNQVEYAIRCQPLENPFYDIPRSLCEVELFKDHFLQSGLLSTIKSTNRILNVLGGIFAAENGYDNCLLLNENKQIVEALNGNIFLVNKDHIKTPPLTDGCLNGIMRKQIISLIKTVPEFSAEEASISPFELQKADEIFITNVIQGIVPITKYRKKEFGDTVARLLLPKLNFKSKIN